MSNNVQSRKRSTSTLANTISFTHTRNNNPPVNIEEEDKGLQRSKTASFGYLQKNNSSSTINSITQTLSNVGFNKLAPIETSHSYNGSTTSGSFAAPPSVNSPTALRSPLSPTVSLIPNTSGKLENAISRAKMYAKTKTKDLKRSSKSNDHHHHFLKKNAHTGLSSAQSNSRLETGSTLYSFDPSHILENTDSTIKHVIAESSLKNLSFDERDQMADDLWATITTTSIQLFKVENQARLKLNTPIEDVDKMFEIYIKSRLENNSSTTSIISEVMEFLRNGMNILENELTFDDNLSEHSVFARISLTWDYFFKHIYHYLIGVLLPLQIAIVNANSNWNEAATDMTLSTKNIVLVAFRDFVVLPYFETEIMLPSELELAERKNLIKCFGMLKSVQSKSYNQQIVEHILMLLLQELNEI